MDFDRCEALALGIFAAGVGLLVFYVIPRIELAIAVFDHAFGGMK